MANWFKLGKKAFDLGYDIGYHHVGPLILGMDSMILPGHDPEDTQDDGRENHAYPTMIRRYSNEVMVMRESLKLGRLHGLHEHAGFGVRGGPFGAFLRTVHMDIVPAGNKSTEVFLMVDLSDTFAITLCQPDGSSLNQAVQSWTGTDTEKPRIGDVVIGATVQMFKSHSGDQDSGSCYAGLVSVSSNTTVASSPGSLYADYGAGTARISTGKFPGNIDKPLSQIESVVAATPTLTLLKSYNSGGTLSIARSALIAGCQGLSANDRAAQFTFRVKFYMLSTPTLAEAQLAGPNRSPLSRDEIETARYLCATFS